MPEVEWFAMETISVNRAFSKQSLRYDADDQQNPVLQDMRLQVYQHVSKFLKEKSHILELNAGTGIDALYLATQGHTVLATDLSDGMIAQLQKKISLHHMQDRLSCQQLSYDQLDKLSGMKFDYVFSNFGGLNCIDDLSKVTQHLPAILNSEAFVTWVIMPPLCPWELTWILKGRLRQAFRRFHRNGVVAHLEGEYFNTYYHSLSQIKKAFGGEFSFVKAEGLCALSPPPGSVNFAIQHTRTYKILRKLDSMVRHHIPFNRWADHLIVTFHYQRS